jgi:hypothetical protein
VAPSRRAAYCSTSRKLETGSMRAPGGEQADLRVERFVLGEGDLLGGHALVQLLTLLGGEVHHGLLQGGGELLAAAVRGGDDAVELTQTQEQARQPQPGATLEGADQVGGDQKAVQEGQPWGLSKKPATTGSRSGRRCRPSQCCRVERGTPACWAT